jgi:hypothetical protein
VGKLLSFLHARVHLVDALPSPVPDSMDAQYLSQHFATGRSRPFVLWSAETDRMYRRYAHVRSALARPDDQAAEALAALAAAPAAQREPQR